MKGTRLFVSLTVLALLALTAWLYPQLPDPFPTHWNLRGDPDGYAPKAWGAFALPVVTAVLGALLAAVPRISPRGYGVEGFARTFAWLSAITVGFLAFVHVVLLARTLGVPLRIERWIPAGIGLLVALLGNRFGKTTRNFFVGIRTPWTLASDEVWLRTHRLGGKLFVLAGAIVFVAALAGQALIALPLALGLAALIPTVYSYWLYRHLA